MGSAGVDVRRLDAGTRLFQDFVSFLGQSAVPSMSETSLFEIYVRRMTTIDGIHGTTLNLRVQSTQFCSSTMAVAWTFCATVKLST